jgi:hypothetical protein
MTKSDHDDRWRAEIVDDDSVPLPEPWFLRDLRDRNAVIDASRPGPERRTLPSDESLNLRRRHDDVPPVVQAPWWRRWWPALAGAAVVLVLLILVLFVPPRVDGASTPVDVAPETSPTVAAAPPAPTVVAPVAMPSDPPSDVETADRAPIAENMIREPAIAAAPDSNPSFDCDSVASHVNKMICASAGLGALDRQLAARQAQVADGLDGDARAELEQSRAEFLSHKMRCEDEACITRAYDDRLAELDAFAEDLDRR